MKKLLKMPAQIVDESMAEQKELINDVLISKAKVQLRKYFDSSLIDTHALAVIAVANELGYTDLAKQMQSDFEEMEAENGN